MTLGWLDILLLILVGAALFFAIRSTVRSFRSGKCPGCGDSCSGHCDACKHACNENKPKEP